MEATKKKHAKKGRNKRVTSNIQRGSVFSANITGLQLTQTTKPAEGLQEKPVQPKGPPADLQKQPVQPKEQAVQPKVSAEPETEEVEEQPQPVNPWVKATDGEKVYRRELDEAEYPPLKRERSVFLKFEGQDVDPEEPPVAVTPEEQHTEASDPPTIQVPELDVVEDSDGETAALESDRAALLSEVERLKQMLRAQTAMFAEAAVEQEAREKSLKLQIADRDGTQQKAVLKVQRLEEALQKEHVRLKETETSLVRQREENSRLAAALVQAEADLQKERLQWQEEKTTILRCLKDLGTADQQKTATDEVGARIASLEQRMAEIQRKPKKLSLWRRFCNLFRRRQ